MRLDLPTPGHDAEVAQLLAARARHEAARRVYVFVFTDEPGAGGRLPRRELYDAICAAMPVPVVDGLLVRDGRCWSYACVNPRCCPPAGRPIDPASPTATSLAAAHALVGRSVLADRAAVLDSIRPLGGVTARSMAEALDRADATLRRASRRQKMHGTKRLLDELLARYQDPRAIVDHDEAAYLHVACRDVLVRDSVLARCSDDQALDRMYRLLRDVARRSVPGRDAPGWGMLGWAAYACGDGVIVVDAAERALRSDPGYSLAQLLLDCLEAQVRPELLLAWCEQTSRDTAL